MSDPATPPPAGAADPGTANNEPAEQTISLEAFSKLEKTVNSLAATLRKQSQAAPAAPAPAAEPDETKTQRQKLEEMQLSMRKDRERLEKKAKRNGIREAISQNGITDPEAIEILFDHVESRHGSKIQVGDDDDVSVLDELGESKTIAAFIGDILKSPKGKYFKPEKAPGPNTRAGRGSGTQLPSQKSYMEMSLDERLKLTPEQLKAATRAAIQGI